jgi:hypothetical protein
MHRWILLFALCWLGLALGCGGKGAVAAGEKKPDLDADPIALLPSSAVVVASVDARGIFDGTGVGAQIASMADKLVPLGDDAGFQAKRDVDRVVAASYAVTGADVAAVVSGRFDEAKIAAATKARNGSPITKTMYAGHAVYATGPGVYTVISGKTLVAGTTDGVRRVLDKIATGKIERTLPPWVLDTLQTQGAEVAVAGDFATQPLAAAAFGSIRLPWVEGLKVARIIGNFDKPGLNVAATLTYTTPEQATSAADGVRALTGWIKLLGPLLGGISLQSFDVQTAAADVQCKASVDDQTLGKLLGMGERFLPSGAP